MYRVEFKETLDEEFGDFHRMEKDYGYQSPSGWDHNSEIALIPITGVIMPGDSQSPGLLGGSFNAGANTIIAQLEEASEDSAVKAIVIRVDSPGGSAFASDQIWRAITLAKKEKPVIVSMGGMAASGGYHVSAPANAIFAEDTTITGSIGVYSGKFNLQGLASMLHVNIETEQRGKNANIYSSLILGMKNNEPKWKNKPRIPMFASRRSSQKEESSQWNRWKRLHKAMYGQEQRRRSLVW